MVEGSKETKNKIKSLTRRKNLRFLKTNVFQKELEPLMIRGKETLAVLTTEEKPNLEQSLL